MGPANLIFKGSAGAGSKLLEAGASGGFQVMGEEAGRREWALLT